VIEKEEQALKRYTSLVVVVIMLFTAIPSLGFASPQVDWKAAYKEYIKQVISAESGFPFEIETVVLIDLDRDGIPELFGGQADRLVSWIVIGETYRNGKNISIYQNGVNRSDRFSIGMYAFSVDNSSSGIKLFKDSVTGEYKYIGTDGYSSAIGWGLTEYEITLNGSTLLAKEIVSSRGPNPGHEDDPDVVEEYGIGGKKVSKANYEKYRASYYYRLTEVEHGAVTIPLAKLYEFNRDIVDEDSITAFLNSYSSSDAIKLNQIPANWAETEIEQALMLKIVPDDLQGGYSNRITRADFCRLVLQTIGIKTGKTLDTLLSTTDNAPDRVTFKDTTDPFILGAYSLGIVSGKGNGMFDPDGNISRQEAAVMLSRAATVMGLNINRSGTNFKDKGQIAEWAKSSVAFVSSAKDSQNGAAVMSGTQSEQFSPKDYYTRQQAIITVKRLYNVQ